MQFPNSFPWIPSILSSGNVKKIMGICTIIPINATPDQRSAIFLWPFKMSQETLRIAHTKNIVRRHPHQQLMQYPTEHKNPRARRIRTPSSPHQGRVDVPPHEMIDRLIPGPPVSPNARTVPPLRIEFSVAKSHYFCQCIKHRLKDRKKSG